MEDESNGTQENAQAQEGQSQQQAQQTTSLQVGAAADLGDSSAGASAGTDDNGGSSDGAGAVPDFKAQIAERDKRIAELEASVAEAAKTAEAADALRAEIEKLRADGDAQRVAFELTMAGAKNVKAAVALLGDHGGDIEKLKAAEPWLFAAHASVPGATGKTGLANAGAASDEGATMKRWRSIAGLDEAE